MKVKYMVNTKNEKLSIVMLGYKQIPSKEGELENVVEELVIRMVQ